MSKSSAKILVGVSVAVAVIAAHATQKIVRKLIKNRAVMPTVIPPLEKTDDCWASDEAQPITESNISRVQKTFATFTNKIIAPFKKRVA